MTLILLLLFAIALVFFIRQTEKTKRPLEQRPAPPPPPRPADTNVTAPRVQPAPVPSTPTQAVPDHLELRLKQYFFSKSEKAFFHVLEEALPAGYRVFPNVRLNDLFLLPSNKSRQGTYARLRDKHVDFLVVSLPDYTPVFAIELDGASHDNEKQQYRDAVKDTAFRSAGLPLVRLRAEQPYTRETLRERLSNEVTALSQRANA